MSSIRVVQLLQEAINRTYLDDLDRQEKPAMALLNPDTSIYAKERQYALAFQSFTVVHRGRFEMRKAAA